MRRERKERVPWGSFLLFKFKLNGFHTKASNTNLLFTSPTSSARYQSQKTGTLLSQHYRENVWHYKMQLEIQKKCFNWQIPGHLPNTNTNTTTIFHLTFAWPSSQYKYKNNILPDRYLAICHPLYSYTMAGLKRTGRSKKCRIILGS